MNVQLMEQRETSETVAEEVGASGPASIVSSVGRSVRPRPFVLFVVLREGKYAGGQFSLSRRIEEKLWW